MLTAVLHSPIAHGALTGILAAAAVDIHAFVGWKDIDEALTYSWRTALFRWAQGAIVGVLSAAGMSGLS